MSTTTRIAALVTEGHALYQSLTEIQARLDAVEAELIEAAKARSDEHQRLSDDEREGRRFIAQTGGPDDLAVPVVFTADKLLSTFAVGSDEHQRVLAATGDKFPQFFKRVVGYARLSRDGKAFRSLARQLFGERADAVIVAARVLDDAGLPKSDIKVEWKQAATPAEILAGTRKKKTGTRRAGKAVAK